MGDTERELEAKIERDEATRLKALGDRGCMLELLEFAVDFFEQARHNDRSREEQAEKKTKKTGLLHLLSYLVQILVIVAGCVTRYKHTRT